MNRTSQQLEVWMSEFGREYTDRNHASAEQRDQEMELWHGGVRKSDLYLQFLPVDRLASGRVLEVGCNIGNQFGMLRLARPTLELWGLEPQAYALNKAKAEYPEAVLVPGNAFDIPFKDGFFEVVMTNGVLIHIHPDDLSQAMSEIYRCSHRFIFLHEYFAEQVREIPYRGHDALLWKMDYKQGYLDLFPDLCCVAERYLQYPDPDGGRDLVDQVALLEKRKD